jgi:hypothetical protein
MEGHEVGRWLQIGLGRPVLVLQTRDATLYRDVILDACLRNLTLDRQLAG